MILLDGKCLYLVLLLVCIAHLFGEANEHCFSACELDGVAFFDIDWLLAAGEFGENIIG